ncbi:MAG: helix-turn-helix transcriptional regulator [Actinomycetota bacterium]|nr:helix-turn-helix transcriptional regulator [Actinomycetota bacterium]
MAREQDFLDEIIKESTQKNPRFPEMLQAAAARRLLLRGLGQKREELGLTQKHVAERMGTSQSAVARMEAGEIDAKLSTVDRYAAAIGQRVQWQLVNGDSPRRSPPVAKLPGAAG